MTQFEQQLLPFGEEPRPRRRNAVVEAGAGTGKTTRIVHDVVMRLLEEPSLRPERIVLVTFTEKAAAEIAERVRWALTDLHAAFNDPEVTWPRGSSSPVIRIAEADRERFRDACAIQISRVDRLRSQTIHSFCQSILRLFPVEAGLDPRFRIVQGFEESTLRVEAFDAWLERETLSDDESLHADWEILLDALNFVGAVRDAIFTLLTRRELIEDDSYSLGSIAPADAALRDALRTLRELDVTRLRIKSDDAAACLELLRAVVPPPTPDLEAWIEALEPADEQLRGLNLPGLPKEISETIKFLRGEERDTMRDKLVEHRASLVLRRAAVRFAAALDREKEERGVVDFDDLLFRTAALLDDERVLATVRARFDLIFVDEFQDTDRLQAKIIDLLARDGSGKMVEGRTTIVGDAKQSIYSFRRADPETFGLTVQRFVDEGAQREFLEDQYRSTQPLVNAINEIFSTLFPDSGAAMTGPVLRPAYRPLRAARAAILPAQPVRFIGAPLPEGEEDEWVEAELVAAWIEKSRDREGSDLRRFAILMRKMTSSAIWADVFDRRGIPLVLPPARALLERRACVDLLTVLRAIAYPFDEAALVAAARTPYFALTDDEIVAWRVASADSQPFRDYRDAIFAWHRQSDVVTVADLIDQLADATSIRALYSTLRGGERSLAHLERFRDLALDYDLSNGGSVRQFVDELQRRRADADDAEPVVNDESENAVRMMTVHASKGLEFETVILPDLAGQGRRDDLRCYATDAPRWLVFAGNVTSLSRHFENSEAVPMKQIEQGRDAAELDRLFYVAVTRAKNEVVFAAAIDKPSLVGFWKPLNKSLGIAPGDLLTLFPSESGIATHELEVNGEKLQLSFERLEIPQRDISSLHRFRSERLRKRVKSLAAPGPALDLPPAVVTPRVELLRTLAASRRRATGIAMHRFLELWSFLPSEAAQTAATVAHELALGGDEKATLDRLVRTIVASDAAKRIAAAKITAREMPIFYLDPTGAAREGRIDLLLRENGRLTVFDYKSGKSSPERETHDREQVLAYCDAIAHMSGEPCDGVLWYIDEKEKAVEVAIR